MTWRPGWVYALLAALLCSGAAATGPGGVFQMGDPWGGTPRAGFSDEQPHHVVTNTPFLADAMEVTKQDWDRVRSWALTNGYPDLAVGQGGSAGGPGTDSHPVVNVSWQDCVKWANARSEQAGRIPAYYADPACTGVYRAGTAMLDTRMVRWTADGFRLPTEAEWEQAARGGLAGAYFPWASFNGFYPDHLEFGRANYWDANHPEENGTRPVGYYNGQQQPPGPDMVNGYGLYDMAGNVSEWCWDWYDGAWYGACASNAWPGDPSGPEVPPASSMRVTRGGSWYVDGADLRCSARDAARPTDANLFQGFRCVRRELPTNQVAVLGFSTAQTGSGPEVRWQAWQDVPAMGFNLYRYADGQWHKLNQELIQPLAYLVGDQTYTYLFVDSGVGVDQAYVWMPVLVTADGRELEGGRFYAFVAAAPDVSAPVATNIFAESADLGATITATNGATVIQRGACWSSTNGFDPATAAGCASESGAWSTGVFSFAVNGLAPGRTHYFRVFAVNAVGTNYTAQAAFLARPAPPQVLGATELTSSGFTARWLLATGATEYFLDVATNALFQADDFVPGYQDRSVGDVSEYPVTGAVPGITCYYRLRAHNATGPGTDSATVAVTRAHTLTLGISPAGAGILSPAAGTHMIPHGESVSLAATPRAPYVFGNWHVAGAGAVADTNRAMSSVIITNDCAVTACFRRRPLNPGITMLLLPMGSNMWSR